MISYKIALLRCGSAGPYAGQSAASISQSSAQALRLLRQSAKYPSVERVYTSPLPRSVQSAGILYPNQTPVEIDGLKDMHLGKFEGKAPEELAKLPDFVAWLQDSRENPPPGGEKAQDFTERIYGAFDALVRQMMRERVTSAAVITHGGVLMALMAAFALPRLPMHEWATQHGYGYTLLTSAQLWMQGGCAEATATIPLDPQDTE